MTLFPALALGLGEGNEVMMQHPPRKGDEAVLTQDHWVAIGLYGLLIAGASLGALAIALRVLQTQRHPGRDGILHDPGLWSPLARLQHAQPRL